MPLIIHIWGGLGSQLYALALLLDLRREYPNRKFKCVFHTGGVTERLPEIVDFLDGLANFSVVFDFASVETSNDKFRFRQNRPSRISFARDLGAKLLLCTGFMTCCNNDSRIYPWTFFIRGHYRTRPLSNYSLQAIAALVQNHIHMVSYSQNLVVHFRLGDLLGLKETISPSRLALAIQNNLSFGPNSKIVVHSDSPKLARDLLLPLIDIELFPSKTIFFTLVDCIYSRVFIGSNSKISYWAVYLRLTKSPDSVCLIPRELEGDFMNALGNLSSFSNLKFY